MKRCLKTVCLGARRLFGGRCTNQDLTVAALVITRVILGSAAGWTWEAWLQGFGGHHAQFQGCSLDSSGSKCPEKKTVLFRATNLSAMKKDYLLALIILSL
ncbi:unnamed protein product [Acanthoscelides obtectus]|uniref:Uncharacterized protein n=1 Tax=Acanthoscelides obtectus TaxID=200917 RepID=A0A9P0MFC1_ACAOB|nr:unnamed protein product [Acanthoscelides obtectus]CAK1685748.1 hypothetical protein AOBTE_LOCUS35584 [Acanthoscelides obtectus]